LVQVSDISLRIKDVPALGIDLVDTEARVEASERCDRGSDPSSGDGGLSGFGTRSIVESKLITMAVTKELLSNNVGRVALDDLVIESRPVLETIGHGGADVTNDPNTLTLVLSSLQLSNQPLELTVRIVILQIGKNVKVVGVAKVGVQGNDTEAWSRAGGVGTIVLDSVGGVLREPARPIIGQTVVQPRSIAT